MTFYQALVFLHVLAAILGIGQVISFDLSGRLGKTKTQMILGYGLMRSIEKWVKAGSVTLVVTGLWMGYLNQGLFSQTWYVLALILYVMTQVVAIGFLGRNQKKQLTILENSVGDTIPESVMELKKKAKPYMFTLHVFTVVFIYLMVFKPM